jgi:hypothetical protein
VGTPAPNRPRVTNEAPLGARPYGSAERLTLAGRRGGLDGVQRAVACDGVFEGGAELRSSAVVAGEVRVGLGDVGGRARALRGRPPVLLRHGQEFERGLPAVAAAYVEFPDLGIPGQVAMQKVESSGLFIRF